MIFDYWPKDAATAAERSLLSLEPLQACFQQTLGHELPNRLVAIQGLAQLLLLEQADRLNEEGRLYLNRLAQTAQQTDKMIRALGDLGRLVRDPGPAVALDLGELAREALAEVKVLFPRRVIEYHLGEGFPALTMAQRPWSALLSLLCRYLVESTREDRACRLAITGESRGEGIEVCVTDESMTRTEDELKPLLEPFGQGAASPGTGLGLFPLRLIVAALQGRLRIRSAPGQGTRFLVAVRLR